MKPRSMESLSKLLKCDLFLACLATPLVQSGGDKSGAFRISILCFAALTAFDRKDSRTGRRVRSAASLYISAPRERHRPARVSPHGGSAETSHQDAVHAGDRRGRRSVQTSSTNPFPDDPPTYVVDCITAAAMTASGANPGARCSVWISAACRNHSQAAGTGITLATKALSMLPAAQAAILQGGFERFQQPSPHWVRKIAGRSIRRRDATTRLTFSHRGGGAGIVRMSGLITLRRSRPQRSVTVTSHAGHRQAESNPRCTYASFPQGLPGVLGPGAVCNRSNFRSHIAKVYARATDKLRNASSSFGRCQERREPVSRPKSKLRLR
jgi:hypothetical protein